MKKLFYFIALISIAFQGIAQEKISKNDVEVEVVDGRADKSSYGKVDLNITWIATTKIKKKDKNNTIFPKISTMFKEEFERRGFPGAGNESKYIMIVNLKNIFYETDDKFIRIDLHQKCEIEVILKNRSTGEILVKKEVSGYNSSRDKDLRRMKIWKKNLFFILSVQASLDKLFEEENFEEYFNQ